MTSQGDREESDDLSSVEDPLLPERRIDRSQTRALKCLSSRHSIRCFKSIAILCAALGLLLLIFAVLQSQMHSIATNAIHSTEMTIKRMHLKNPTNSTVSMDITMQIRSNQFFSAHLQPGIFHIRYIGQIVGKFQAALIRIRHGENIIKLENQTLNIGTLSLNKRNTSGWNTFARDMIRNTHIRFRLDALLSISVPIGPFRLTADHIALKKHLDLQGLQGLKTLRIGSIEMSHSTPHKVLANVNACVYNPSVLSLQTIGNLCLEGYHQQALICRLQSYELASSLPITFDESSSRACIEMDSEYMAKGYNVMRFRGEIIPGNQSSLSSLVSDYLSNRSTDLVVKTCSLHATDLDIFDEPLRNLTITTQVPPRPTPFINQMNFERMLLRRPDPLTSNKSVEIEATLQVEVSSPLGSNSPLRIQKIDLNVSLSNEPEGSPESLLGNLWPYDVTLVNATLIGDQNLTINTAAHLAFGDRGKRFGDFVRSTINSKQTRIWLRGSMHIKAVGALGKNVLIIMLALGLTCCCVGSLNLQNLSVDVVTTFSGMSGLHNVSVVNFLLPGQRNKTAITEPICVNISVWNPSIFSISLGPMTLAIRTKKELFGHIEGEFALQPHATFIAMNGTLQPELDKAGFIGPGLTAFFSRYLQGLSNHLTAIVVEGEFRRCQWMNAALLGLEIKTQFRGVSPTYRMIREISFHELDIMLEPSHDASVMGNTAMSIRIDLAARIELPPSIQIAINISRIRVGLELINVERSSMGILQSTEELCDFESARNMSLSFNMTRYYPIQLHDKKQVISMAHFINQALNGKGEIPFGMQTKLTSPDEGAFPVTSTQMGILRLFQIPIEAYTNITSLNRFASPPIRISALDIIAGTSSSLVIQLQLVLENPSVLSIKLGALSLDVYYQNTWIGTAQIANFVLHRRQIVSVLNGTFIFKPEFPTDFIPRSFLSNFVSGYFTDGKAQVISIRGSASSSNLELLKPALGSLLMQTKLETLASFYPYAPTLVSSSMIYLDLLQPSQVETSLELRNPFQETITITGADLQLYPCKWQQGSSPIVCLEYHVEALARFSPDPFQMIQIPARTSSCFSCCLGNDCTTKQRALCPDASKGICMKANLTNIFSMEAVWALIRSATSVLLVRVNGTVNVSIGSYKTSIFYAQDSLLVAESDEDEGCNLTVEEYIQAECEKRCKLIEQEAEEKCRELQQLFLDSKQSILDACEADKENEQSGAIAGYDLLVHCQSGPYRGKDFVLKLHQSASQSRNPAVCLIGRSTGKKFKVPMGLSLPKDSEISTTHAEFRVDPLGKIVFTDLDSTNGSIVNGQIAVSQEGIVLSMTESTVIEVGKSKLRVVIVKRNDAI
uniref:Uncharacterized protein AlNc14C88G5584 n=1 Tax=Albugo laibachii Nc14 TaxID=890382 RepID=F0WG54_9STRA|nr:conserved hypothetical protein [Albugo laibachii Nc14]|eukprot:CCA20189.1 conserved hypothetical protein [Albugo laibachii Nc14]